MQEIVPGIWWWTAVHEPIGGEVSSYFAVGARAVIDPKVPPSGFDELPSDPELILLTSGHHVRDAEAYVDHYGGIRIRAIAQAAAHAQPMTQTQIDPVDDGTEIATGITAVHVGVISDDESTLHIDLGDGGGALALADGAHNLGGRDELATFPDHLLGDDPDGVRRGLKTTYARLIETLPPFDTLLTAHGEPIAAGGRSALDAFTRGQA